MIRLSVEDYCNNCPEFEIEEHVDEMVYNITNMYTGETSEEKSIQRTIRCKHKERCRGIAAYISEKLSKG